jgi:hypothetical protein
MEETKRPFRCKCGKGYLSYPALYTHIKHKVGDKRAHSKVGGPEPSSMPTKRGRPPAKEETREVTEGDILEDMNNEARNEIELLLIDLIEDQSPAQDAVLEGNDYPREEDLAEAFAGELPQPAAQQLWEALKRIAGLAEEALYLADLPRIKDNPILLPVYEVLARFLHGLAQQLKPAYFREVALLMVLFADTINQARSV